MVEVVFRTTLRARGDVVLVELGSLATVLAFRHRIEVPRRQISRAVAVDRGSLEPHLSGIVRRLGTHVPGLLRFGSYGIGADLQFWAVGTRRRVLVLETSGRYRRIVLGVPEPDAVAARLAV